MKKILLVMAMAMMAIMSVAVMAATETTTTAAAFNIASVTSFSVTLPSTAPATSAPGGTATTGIAFNSTDGTDADVNARVVGGIAQSDGTPIFSIDNDGTTILNMSIAIAAGLPACMDLMGGTVYATITQNITNTPYYIDETFAPADTAITFYLQTDFAACASADSTSKTITLTGVDTVMS
jgi:hypothetical protein